MSILHKFQSTKPNSADATKVRASNWNDDHVITDIVPTNGNFKWDNALSKLLIGFANNFTGIFATKGEIRDTPANWPGLTTLYNVFRVVLGGLPPNVQHANGGNATTEALVGCNQIPSNSPTTSFGSGISGYARSACIGTPGVAGYFQGMNNGDSFGAYGLNTVTTNASTGWDNPGQGYTTDMLVGIECNLNNMPTANDVYGEYIIGASNANPIVITTKSPHGRSSGNIVTIYGVMGNTQANGTFGITVLSPTTFSIPRVGNGVFTPYDPTTFPQKAFVSSSRSGAKNEVYFQAVGSSSSRGREQSYAFFANHPSVFFRSTQWDAAFISGTGSAHIGLELGTDKDGFNAGSQSIVLHAMNASGIAKNVQILADPDGNLGIILQPESIVSISGRSIRVPSGTPTEPGIAFGNELSTGFYSQFPGVVQVTCKGHPRIAADGDNLGFTIDGNARVSSGAGLPNGSKTGNKGDLYLMIDGGANTTMWVKESGNGTNTGWVGK